MYLFTERVIKLTVVIIEECHCYHLHTKLSKSLLSGLTLYVEEIIGDHRCVFLRNRSTNDQLFCIRHVVGGKWNYIWADYECQAFDSVAREVLLHNILIEFGVPMELIWLMKTFNWTCCKVLLDTHLSDAFPIQNGGVYSHYYSSCLRIRH